MAHGFWFPSGEVVLVVVEVAHVTQGTVAVSSFEAGGSRGIASHSILGSKGNNDSR